MPRPCELVLYTYCVTTRIIHVYTLKERIEFFAKVNLTLLHWTFSRKTNIKRTALWLKAYWFRNITILLSDYNFHSVLALVTILFLSRQNNCQVFSKRVRMITTLIFVHIEIDGNVIIYCCSKNVNRNDFLGIFPHGCAAIRHNNRKTRQMRRVT